MKKIENLKDLLLEEGRELYDANKQELKELKNLEMQASAVELKKLIKKQTQQTEKQQQNLRGAFERLKEDCEGGRCETTQTIFKRAQQLINESKAEDTRDASIISSLQKLGHYKMAGMGVGASYAREIGKEDTAKVFHDALEQEKEIDKELSALARQNVNRRAAHVLMA